MGSYKDRPRCCVCTALSSSDIVEQTLSLTERANFETFLWAVGHTRSPKTCHEKWVGPSLPLPLLRSARKYAIYTPHMCLLMWHALALCLVTVRHQSAAHAHAHAHSHTPKHAHTRTRTEDDVESNLIITRLTCLPFLGNSPVHEVCKSELDEIAV